MNPTLIANLLRLAVKQGPAAVRAALAQLKKSGVADDVISSVMTKVAPPARKLPKNGARGGVKGMAPRQAAKKGAKGGAKSRGAPSKGQLDLFNAQTQSAKESSRGSLKAAEAKPYSGKATRLDSDARKANRRIRKMARDASRTLSDESNKGFDDLSQRLGTGKRPGQQAATGSKAGAKGSQVRENAIAARKMRRGTRAGAKASQQSQYGPQTTPPSSGPQYTPQTNPNPTSGPRPGKDKMKWKTRAKGALRFAKENPGKAALSAGLGGLGVLGGVQFAEQLGTTAGLDPFDYQGRLKKVRDLQAIPGFVEGVEGGGELFLEGERNRLLKGLMERGGSPDPIGDLLADQDLRTILEGREAELRGLGVGMSPEPLSPSEIAARLGL